MTASIDVSMMDFLMQKDELKGADNYNIKNEMDLDLPGFVYNNTEDNFINDVWPSNPDEFLDSILNDGGQLEGVLDPSPKPEIEFEDQFHDDEILSSTMSSPGPSISEVGVQSSPVYSEEENSPSYVSEIVYSEVQNNPTVNLQSSITKTTNSPKVNQRVNLSSTNNNFNNGKSLPTVTILNQKNLQSKLAGKVIRVQTVPGNPRSILLPVSVKDLRTIKIINAPTKKIGGNIKLTSANLLQHAKKVSLKNNIIFTQAEDVSNDTIDMTASTSDEDQCDGSNSETSANGSSYPRLQLTAEEQRLLAKEGITLPSSYPLTKHEERELKRIRRKIRNKISAQDSRKRKKEYVDGLEDRVKQCTEENQTLLKRIKLLQTQNQSLVSQLRRLQALVSRKVSAATGSTTTNLAGGAAIGKAQPATCLMVLLLSLALIAVPSLKRTDNNSTDLRLSDTDIISENKVDEYIGKRALLFKPGEDNIDDELNMDELLTFHNDNINGVSPAKKARMLEPIQQYDELSLDGFSSNQQKSAMLPQISDPSITTKKYIEPPLDETWPLSGHNIIQSDNGRNLNVVDSKLNTSQTNNVVILRVPEDQ